MKVQLQGQALRLRIDEAELARLLRGEALRNETRWPDGQTRWQQLALAERPGWRREEPGWCLWLAEAAVRELAARLPSRDGLLFELPTPDGTALDVRFDVDVRDSARQRLPRHPPAGDAP